jgi:hypothetical protein
MAMAAYFLGVLEISLGNYDSALGCLGAASATAEFDVGCQLRDVGTTADRRALDGSRFGNSRAMVMKADTEEGWKKGGCSCESWST